MDLFGRKARSTTTVEFPAVSNLAGVVSFEEPSGAIELFLSTDRKQVEREGLIGKTIGELFRSNYGGQAPAAYVMLKGGTSLPVQSNYVLTDDDVANLSQIKSTSQAASLA